MLAALVQRASDPLSEDVHHQKHPARAKRWEKDRHVEDSPASLATTGANASIFFSKTVT